MPDKHQGPYQLLKISGEDAASFLQGQLSNDIYLLDDSWQYSGVCNPKGRLLAILRLWQHQQVFFALVASDLADHIVQRLSIYVLRSKVVVETVEQASVYCFESADKLQQFDPLLNFPAARSGYFVSNRSADDGSTIFALGSIHGLLYICHRSVPAPQDQDQSVSRWQDSCIAAGVAEITRPTAEAFVPQMVNLDLIGGISFKKGCYTGQEIVARMHYLGNLKQRMLLCTVEGEARQPLAAGQKVYSDAKLNTHSGTLVSISRDGNYVLAVLRLAHLQQSLILENGQSLKVAAQQPYDIGTAAE
ncbi:MAG: hypothetical protein KJP04_11650 [Arenicella sp.]|nr:hypothetical protein [Arenicella sp.]